MTFDEFWNQHGELCTLTAFTAHNLKGSLELAFIAGEAAGLSQGVDTLESAPKQKEDSNG